MERIIAVLEKVEAAGRFTDELRVEALNAVSGLTLEELDVVQVAFDAVLQRIAEKREPPDLDS